MADCFRKSRRLEFSGVMDLLSAGTSWKEKTFEMFVC